MAPVVWGKVRQPYQYTAPISATIKIAMLELTMRRTGVWNNRPARVSGFGGAPAGPSGKVGDTTPHFSGPLDAQSCS
jgi:hypothetical protein